MLQRYLRLLGLAVAALLVSWMTLGVTDTLIYEDQPPAGTAGVIERKIKIEGHRRTVRMTPTQNAVRLAVESVHGVSGLLTFALVIGLAFNWPGLEEPGKRRRPGELA
ncbi:hypothetical protein DMC25_22560 [Caulobacter sp. D4A]|uniref:hypothetical protein n=1 Tax=unclassified Caulobacter TaxID=2648921 RepID=UPI000D72A8A6|nr:MULTISPECIES: hypothetical protein [unclassified Caulobacter]PXA78511.1 hypothetical protein DMC25_22560 [Caulobacter sp. D4A]PXA94839.1 hypothetical protein DMC18_05315 [Caulobacter sp. D5]